MIEEELEEKQRIVLITEHFVALELFASPTPFCTHIYPRRHMASFGDISSSEIADLARTLRVVLAKLYHGLDNPDFNYTVRSAPAECVGVKYFHWYVSIIPRLTRVAGFELGRGCSSILCCRKLLLNSSATRKSRGQRAQDQDKTPVVSGAEDIALRTQAWPSIAARRTSVPVYL